MSVDNCNLPQLWLSINQRDVSEIKISHSVLIVLLFFSTAGCGSDATCDPYINSCCPHIAHFFSLRLFHVTWHISHTVLYRIAHRGWACRWCTPPGSRSERPNCLINNNREAHWVTTHKPSFQLSSAFLFVRFLIRRIRHIAECLDHSSYRILIAYIRFPQLIMQTAFQTKLQLLFE